MRHNKNLMDINIDALYDILKQNQGNVNDSMGSKKKTVVVNSDPLALIADKTNVSRSKEKVVVSSDSEGSEADDFSELKKITALLAKAFNRRKFYSKPTNNNLRTSSSSQSANKKQEFVKTDDKKKDKNEQVLLAKDQAWMESSSDSDQEINTNMVFMAQIEKVLSDSEVSLSSPDEKISELKELIEKNNDLIAQTKVLKEQLQVKHVVIDTHVECLEKYAKLKAERYEYMIRLSAYFDNNKQHKKQIADQQFLFDKIRVQMVELDKHVRDLKNTVLEKDFKISELEECVRNKDLEIEKCLEHLNVCENTLHKMGQTNQTVHMIMPSKDNLYNGRKGIGFENPSYFEKAKDLRPTLYDEKTVYMIMPSKDNLCNGRKGIGFENPNYFKKAKDLRPTLYDEKVIGLGYSLMFLTYFDEALEIEKFKRSRENKIEFAYDYGNLNASYVNEKINFEDDYFQDIINLDFEKIDFSFQQTSSLKLYVLNVILEKIIIDLEVEVVNLLEKEKANLETIESLKSKGFESSENVSSESENNCLVVEKECDKEENLKVIAPEMFRLNVLQCISSISMSKSSCESNNVEIKLKRKRRKRKSSKQNVKEVDNDISRANNDFVYFSDLDTFSSVRRPKNSSVIWKKKGNNVEIKLKRKRRKRKSS
nr:hypothetical protein [Tanacetum cinerariifolium]